MAYLYEATRSTFHFYTEVGNHEWFITAPKRHAVLWPEEHPHTVLGLGF